MSALLMLTNLPRCLRRNAVFKLARGKPLQTNYSVRECQQTLDLIGLIMMRGQIYYICLAKMHAHTRRTYKCSTQVMSERLCDLALYYLQSRILIFHSNHFIGAAGDCWRLFIILYLHYKTFNRWSNSNFYTKALVNS